MRIGMKFKSMHDELSMNNTHLDALRSWRSGTDIDNADSCLTGEVIGLLVRKAGVVSLLDEAVTFECRRRPRVLL